METRIASYHCRDSLSCPWCDADLAFLSAELRDQLFVTFTYNGKRYWEFSGRAVDFCTRHQAESAQQRWHELSIPAIDWKRIPARIEQIIGELYQVVDDPFSTYYASRVEHAATKKALVAHPDHSPDLGYYGQRGKIAVASVLKPTVFEYARSLPVSKLSPGMLSMGLGNWCLDVVVPYALCRLTMEDMKLEEQAARSFMKETDSLGLLLSKEIASDS